MNLVKIGNRVINLDLMTYSAMETRKLWVRFSASESTLPQVFEKGEASALWTILENSSKPIA